MGNDTQTEALQVLMTGQKNPASHHRTWMSLRTVTTSLLLCLLFLGGGGQRVPSREERDDLLKQQDAARHSWEHKSRTGEVNFGRQHLDQQW